MKKKVLDIINEIRAAKDLTAVEKLNSEDNLRDNLGLNSFDLAELTVKIEDEFDIDIWLSASLKRYISFLSHNLSPLKLLIYVLKRRNMHNYGTLRNKIIQEKYLDYTQRD